MKIVTDDGQKHEGRDAAELVRVLHKASYSPASNDAEFMRQLSEQTMFATGKVIRFDTPDRFVEDLLKAGLIKAIPEGKDEYEDDDDDGPWVGHDLKGYD